MVMVGLAVLVALSAFLLRGEAAPFRFLQGQEGLRFKPEYERQRAMTAGRQIETVDYSFEADFDTVVRQARQELLALGFVEISGDYPHFERHADDAYVGIWKDERVYKTDTGAGLRSMKAPGWVYVNCYNVRQPNLWERFLRLVGLD